MRQANVLLKACFEPGLGRDTCKNNRKQENSHGSSKLVESWLFFMRFFMAPFCNEIRS